MANAETLQPVHMSRRKKNRIIFIQKSSNIITCSFKSTHTTQILLESIMQCKRILIGLLEYLFPSFWFCYPYVEQASYAQLQLFSAHQVPSSVSSSSKFVIFCIFVCLSDSFSLFRFIASLFEMWDVFGFFITCISF